MGRKCLELSGAEDCHPHWTPSSRGAAPTPEHEHGSLPPGPGQGHCSWEHRPWQRPHADWGRRRQVCLVLTFRATGAGMQRCVLLSAGEEAEGGKEGVGKASSTHHIVSFIEDHHRPLQIDAVCPATLRAGRGHRAAAERGSHCPSGP